MRPEIYNQGQLIAIDPYISTHLQALHHDLQQPDPEKHLLRGACKEFSVDPDSLDILLGLNNIKDWQILTKRKPGREYTGVLPGSDLCVGGNIKEAIVMDYDGEDIGFVTHKDGALHFTRITEPLTYGNEY